LGWVLYYFGVESLVFGDGKSIQRGNIYMCSFDDLVMQVEVVAQCDIVYFPVAAVLYIIAGILEHVIELGFTKDLVISRFQAVVLGDGRVFVVHALEVQDLETEGAAHGDGKAQVLIPEGVVPACIVFGDAVSKDLFVISILVQCCFTVVGGIDPFTIGGDIHHFITVKVTDGLADLDSMGRGLDGFACIAGIEIIHGGLVEAVGQRYQPVVIMRTVDAGVPLEVL